MFIENLSFSLPYLFFLLAREGESDGEMGAFDPDEYSSLAFYWGIR